MTTKTEQSILDREKRTRAANKARSAEQKKAAKEAKAETTEESSKEA